MWLRIPIHALRIDWQWWLPICGVLLAALVLEPEDARAGDDFLQRREGGFGHTTSLLELVMPFRENLTQRAEPRRPARPAASPVPSASLAIPPGTDRPAPGEPVVGENRIPIRVNAGAVLGINDLFVDPARGVLERKEPLLGTNAEQSDRLDFGREPISARSRSDPSARPPDRSGWLGEHVHLDLSDGVSYRTHFEWQDMNLGLKIYGPVVKGHAGLGASLRGLELGGHLVEVRARTTTHQQDLQVRIEF
jgi:hypothetical protein